MPVNSLERFLAFSAEVTAFKIIELYGTGQAANYLEAVEDVVGPDLVADLLAAFETAPPTGAVDDPAVRLAALRRNVFGDARLGPVARNIVKLWYAGVWYELPADWTESFGPAPGDVTATLSPAAYVEGLLWKAIGAHPAGAKPQGFGSWAEPPQIPKF